MEARAIAILSIPPLRRRDSEVAVLVELTRHLNFFQTISEDTGSAQVHKACCQRMTLTCVEPETPIIEFGKVGHEFYIVLSGSAEISVPSSRQDGSFAVVKSIGPGDSFGEQALMTGKPRAATVTATSPMKLAVLSKDSYQALIANLAEKEIHEKTDFLQQLPLLQDWSRLALVKLSYYFDLVQCKRKQVLFSKDSPVDCVYFVKSGEFLVSADVLVDTKTVVQQNSHTYKTMYGSSSLLNLKNSRQVRIQTKKKLAYKGKNELIGVEEAVAGKTLHELTCECVSMTGELYCIKVSEFLSRFGQNELFPRRLPRKQSSSPVQSARLSPPKIITASNFKRPSFKLVTRHTTRSFTNLPSYPQTSSVLKLVKTPQTPKPSTLFKKKPPKRHHMRKLAPPNYLLSVRQGLNGPRLQRNLPSAIEL